jgi:hypothetical protein
MKQLAGVVVAAWCLGAPSAQATTLSMDFSKLPSAQGWNYEALNYGGAAPVESNVYSVDGNQLTQNTMGQGLSYASYSLYNAIDPNLPFTIQLTARVTQMEVTGSAIGRATAFYAYAQAGTALYGFSLNTDTMAAYGGSDFTNWLAFDATQFHTFRIEATPGLSNKIFVDNVLFFDQAPALVAESNLLGLGNASSYENGVAEVTQYSFIQSAVPEPESAVMLLAGLATLLGVQRRRRAGSQRSSC